MPAGCDYVCENEACSCHSTGFTLTSIWPLGDIERVMVARNVSRVPELVKGLEEEKAHDHFLACINFPNVDSIPYIGYRVSKWCKKCTCLWKFDVMIPEERLLEQGNPIDKASLKAFDEQKEKEVKKATEDGAIENECPTCKERLTTFEELLEDGLPCPHCHEELSQQRWYSNELNMKE